MAQQIPGITVTIENDAGVIAPPLFQRYPTIVGFGDPYKRIDNEPVVRSLGTVDDIPCISTIHEIVSVGDLPGIAKYSDGVDYELVSGQNKIHWLGATTPSTGDTFYVTFTETRNATAFNNALLYFDENQVYANHGAATRTNGDINDVAIGARLAFQNGAKGVEIVQLDPMTFTDPDAPTDLEEENAFVDAVDALEKVTDYKLLLVPMSSGTLVTTTAMQILFNHAVVASQPANKQERTVIGAMPVGTSYTDFAIVAQAYEHERMVITAVPSAVQVTGFTGSYDDRFYNAALAGLLCSGAIGQTFHDEILAGITLSDNFLLGEQNFLVQNGCAPAKERLGVVRNIMAITTDTTSALTEDLGVQDVKDYVKKFWRDGLWNVYRNKPITASLPAQVANSSVGILKQLVRDKVISTWSSVAASQDPVEPRKINVSGKIQPAYGMAYMDVVFVFTLGAA